MGYPCCTSSNPQVVSVDENGSWGIENNEWCGIKKSDTSNKITTSTKTLPKITTTTTTTSRTTRTTTTTTQTPKPSNCVANYGQCGGNGYIGSTCCSDPTFTCYKYNENYHQCIPSSQQPNYGW